ncbi:hypothetical protein [Phascolarctobacterium sp.]
MKKKADTTIRSSAAEYLTYVASAGDQQDSEVIFPLFFASFP